MITHKNSIFNFKFSKCTFFIKSKETGVDMMDACGTGSAMVITIQNNTFVSSPNFPSNYPNNMDCTWHIVADHDKGIELSLKGHELEKEYDFFFLFFQGHAS